MDSNPRALFTAYKYVGGARTQTFDPVGSRGTTTAGDPKGTGDADQYPPLPFGNSISDEGFEALEYMALQEGVDIAGLPRTEGMVLVDIIRGSVNNPNSPTRKHAINQLQKHAPKALQQLIQLGFV